MIRIRPERILPLELWDLRVKDGILWDHRSSPGFGQVLCEAMTGVWHGSAVTRSEGRLEEAVRRFGGIFLAGGGAAQVEVDLQGGPWKKVICSAEGGFAGEAGGFALLEQRGFSGWVVDLGQSSLKLSAVSRRWTWPRDFGRLPVRGDNPLPEDPPRAELRHFLHAALAECLEVIGKPPEAMVWALPSRLDDAGIPEGSSYNGMKGDVSLVPEVLAAAGLGGCRILVLNDAELAAVSAQLDPRVAPRTLVLTIGFGVGGALIL